VITDKTTLGYLDQWIADRLLGYSITPVRKTMLSWTAMLRRGPVAWTGEGKTPTEALAAAMDAYATSGTPRMTTHPEDERNR
jgi:hypothetical protein